MIGAHCKLKDRFVKKFLTLENEQIIFSTRQHWLALIPSFILNVVVGLFVIVFFSLSSILAPLYFFTFLLISLVFLTLVLEIFIKQTVEWFFHFYIVTNRKIVEVSYKPLLSRSINEVLLDQVRCTEIDVETKGFINELLNIGTIILTFDRPTHRESFTIEKIKHPRRIAMHIGDSFELKDMPESERIWYKSNSNHEKSRYKYIENLRQI